MATLAICSFHMYRPARIAGLLVTERIIQKRLLSLNKNQFGYNAFGLKENTNRDLYDYLKGYKEKYFDLNFMV